MKRIYSIDGNEKQRREILNKIRGSLGDYEEIIFDSDDSCDFVSHTLTEMVPFVDRKRLYIIRGIPSVPNTTKSQARTKAVTELANVIPIIPPGNVVVFDNLGIGAKKFLELVSKHGEVHQFAQTMDLASARKRVTSYFEGNGQSISYDDAKFLVERLGNVELKVNIDTMELILIKMGDIIGKKGKVTRNDIYAAYEYSEAFIIWNLFDKLDSQDYCSSLKILMKYLNRESDLSKAVSYLMSMLYWRYGLLACAKGGLVQEMRKDEIAKQIGEFKKLRRTGKAQYMCYSTTDEDGKPVGPAYKMQTLTDLLEGKFGRKSVVGTFSFVHLAMIYYALGQASVKIRSKCTEAETILALQFILMTICRLIKKRDSLELLDNPELRWLRNMNAMENELLK